MPGKSPSKVSVLSKPLSKNSKAQKQEKLSQVNITLEKLRFYYRLGNELGVYKSGLHKEFAGRINEIGRMTGGWIKSLK